jgi:hypothetical protein
MKLRFLSCQQYAVAIASLYHLHLKNGLERGVSVPQTKRQISTSSVYSAEAAENYPMTHKYNKRRLCFGGARAGESSRC